MLKLGGESEFPPFSLSGRQGVSFSGFQTFVASAYQNLRISAFQRFSVSAISESQLVRISESQHFKKRMPRLGSSVATSRVSGGFGASAFTPFQDVSLSGFQLFSFSDQHFSISVCQHFSISAFPLHRHGRGSGAPAAGAGAAVGGSPHPVDPARRQTRQEDATRGGVHAAAFPRAFWILSHLHHIGGTVLHPFHAQHQLTARPRRAQARIRRRGQNARRCSRFCRLKARLQEDQQITLAGVLHVSRELPQTATAAPPGRRSAWRRRFCRPPALPAPPLPGRWWHWSQ